MTGVVVTYDEDPEHVRAAIDSLRAQTRPPDEIVLVDNKPGALLPPLDDAPEVRVVAPDVNLGYPNAINFAVERIDADYILCLNPDALADPGCLAALLAVAEADPQVAIVGAQILFEDGERTQAGANPLHPTGISPAGPMGAPRLTGPPRDAIVVSGACCLMRREAFVALGGFMRDFFLYYDDADLGWRACIAGYRVVFVPEARVTHGYEFGRRAEKMLHLERNRLISVLSNYELRSLVTLAPLLLLFELAVIAFAFAQGWGPQRLGIYGSLLGRRAEIAAHRRRVQATRRRSDRELRPLFATHLESPFLPELPARLAGALTAAYLRLV